MVAERRAIEAALERLPRVDLGVTATPLHDATRLSAALGGPRILVKRDDMAGGPLGGNKTRMLEVILGKAVAAGADTVVGGSAAQSNYSRQLAAGCARAGLDCHLVLRRVRGEALDEPQGSLLLDVLYGAKVELVGDDRDEQVERLTALADELTAAGRTVFKAPQASTADWPLHAAAYVPAAFELLDQLAAIDVVPTALVLSSLDMTHAGLLLGLRAGGATFPIHAVSPYEASILGERTVEEAVVDVAHRAATMLGSELTFEPAGISTTFAFVGPGYGQLTDEAVEAMGLFARTEAIVLDPVYSAKAAAALIADIADGRYGADDTVVFWHSGGLPALFAYADELGPRLRA